MMIPTQKRVKVKVKARPLQPRYYIIVPNGSEHMMRGVCAIYELDFAYKSQIHFNFNQHTFYRFCRSREPGNHRVVLAAERRLSSLRQ